MKDTEINKSLCDQIDKVYFDAFKNDYFFDVFCTAAKDFKLTPEKFERELFKISSPVYKRFLYSSAWDALIKFFDKQIKIEAGTFSGVFSGREIFNIKYKFDNLIKPKEREYFFTGQEEIDKSLQTEQITLKTVTPETPKQTDTDQTKSVYKELETIVEDGVQIRQDRKRILTSVQIFVRLNNDKGGLEVSFDGRPEKEIIDGLKQAGMWYVFTERKWVCKATPAKLEKVNAFLEQIEYKKAA